MKLKNKHIVSVAIAGLILILFGTLRRIMHHPGADMILKTGYYFLISASFLFLLKVLLNTDKNNFLNK